MEEIDYNYENIDVTHGRGYVYSLRYHMVWCTKYRKNVFGNGITEPQCRLSDAVKVFKGNTARWLFMEHPELKKELWGGHLWNPSYFVVTVSERSSEQVRRYIEEQRTK